MDYPISLEFKRGTYIQGMMVDGCLYNYSAKMGTTKNNLIQRVQICMIILSKPPSRKRAQITSYCSLQEDTKKA